MVTRRNVDMKKTRQSHKQTPVATGSTLKMCGARTLLLRSKAKTIALRSGAQGDQRSGDGSSGDSPPDSGGG